ncbi:hypothetical protein AAKU52_003142 [Pedobacter sp. CG_S7]|uniref:hypothetical protein n=1 Tax=Pedobacter sp. CG_S7 TaxID=3143930 RepID=UPI0033988298
MNGKAFWKKKPRERSEQGRFFFKNKRRTSRLVRSMGLLRNLPNKSLGEILIRSLKAVKEDPAGLDLKKGATLGEVRSLLLRDAENRL